MLDPDAEETPERLNAMAIMAAFDSLPACVREAISSCEQQVSPFRARHLLNQRADAAALAKAIQAIETPEDVARFHGVTAKFATGKPQPKERYDDPGDIPLSARRMGRN